jgi:hypothetical protein
MIFSRKVPNGTYTLELSFADPMSDAPGQRIFNVIAEDQPILTNFDVTAAAGKGGAITRIFTVTVDDGRLSLGFTGVKGNALISSIELRRGRADVDWTWLDEPDANVARYEADGAVVDDKLYVFGGYRNKDIQSTAAAEVFDPATDKWTRLSDMPEPLTHTGIAVHGTTIWLLGGFVGDNPGPGTKHVWKYNTLTDEWTPGPSLPKSRGAGAAAIVGSTIHFFGGLDHAWSSANPVTQDYADHWTLDLQNGGGWQDAAPMINPRNHLAGVSLNGYVYAIGGQHLWNEDHPLSEVDRYDPATDTWLRVADLPKPRSHMNASTFVLDNRIMVIGGATTDFVALSDIDSYNPDTDSWIHVDDLPSPRATPVAGFAEGSIVVATGSEFDLTPDAGTFAAITVD